MKDIELLKAAVNTLNSISVRGKDDIDSLLGVILALEKIIKENEVATDG